VAATTYATLPELKAMRGIDDTDDDLMLGKALVVASRRIDGKTNRRFWLDDEAVARTFSAAGRVTAGRLLVDDIGSLDDLVVETGTTGSWTATTDYETGPDNALSQGWPVTELVASGWSCRVRITARWGWPAVPEDIQMATLMLASRLYLRKDSPQGVLNSAEWGPVRVSRWDPDVEALVAPYIQPRMP
jgi:hypothetical protein